MNRHRGPPVPSPSSSPTTPYSTSRTVTSAWHFSPAVVTAFAAQRKILAVLRTHSVTVEEAQLPSQPSFSVLRTLCSASARVRRGGGRSATPFSFTSPCFGAALTFSPLASRTSLPSSD